MHLYLFGKIESGYTHYPADQPTALFSKIVEMAPDDRSVIVYREKNKIWYCFIRKYFYSKRYLGIAIELSNKYIKYPKLVFSIGNDFVEYLVREGFFFKPGSKDGIIDSSRKFEDNIGEATKAMWMLERIVDKRLDESFFSDDLPMPDYSMPHDASSTYFFSKKEEEELMLRSTYTMPYTIIVGEYHLKLENDITGKIKRYEKRIDELRRRNMALRLKKWRIVVAAFLVGLLLAVGAYVALRLHFELPLLPVNSDTDYSLPKDYIALRIDGISVIEKKVYVKIKYWTLGSADSDIQFSFPKKKVRSHTLRGTSGSYRDTVLRLTEINNLEAGLDTLKVYQRTYCGREIYEKHHDKIYFEDIEHDEMSNYKIDAVK